MDERRNIYAGVLSGNVLKIAACISMFIDHLGMILFPGVTFLRIVGRIAMPLFAFTFAEGCFYTRRKWRHFFLIFGLGILTSAAQSFLYREVQGNILITFSLSCLLIYSLDAFKRGIFARRVFGASAGGLALVASLAAAVFLCCFSGISVDYGIGGVLLPLTVHLFDFRPFGARGFLSSLYSPVTVFALFFLGQIALAVALGGIQIFSVFSMLLIVLYRGERGKRNIKYLFYIFYPAHLLFLWGIYFLFLSLSEASIFSIF